MYVGLLWLREFVRVAPLLPVALTLRGRWVQLTVVHGLLLFVISDFAPLMVDQPYPSASWLLARTGLGLARSFFIGGVMAALLRMPPRETAAR